MKPYSSYKDSGIAWIGPIPSHWEIKGLRSYLTMISEKGHGDKQLLSVTREQGVIVRNTDSKEENHNFIPDDLNGYKLVKKGQFAINKMKSWQGSYGVSEYEGIVSPAYFVCDLTFPYKPFFSMAIRSKAYIPFFTQYSKGIRVDQWDLSPLALKSIPFIEPPVDEQEAIVRFITEKSEKIDRYIAEQERLLATLDELRQAEIARAVTRGLNPDAPLRDSGIDWIGSIPAHWEKRRYKDILSSEDEKVGDNPITLLSLSKNGGIIIRDLSENKGKFPKDFATYKIVRPGNLVMCLFDVDETPRTVGLSHHHGMITGAYDIFSIRNIDSRFLEYHLLEIDNRKAFKSLYKGLRKTIPTPSLLGSYIYIPPLDDQQAIVEYLDARTAKIDSMKADIQRQIGLLKEYKQRIIADAVTGKIDVRE